jgi:hypothetical protein
MVTDLERISLVTVVVLLSAAMGSTSHAEVENGGKQIPIADRSTTLLTPRLGIGFVVGKAANEITNQGGTAKHKLILCSQLGLEHFVQPRLGFGIGFGIDAFTLPQLDPFDLQLYTYGGSVQYRFAPSQSGSFYLRLEAGSSSAKATGSYEDIGSPTFVRFAVGQLNFGSRNTETRLELFVTWLQTNGMKPPHVGELGFDSYYVGFVAAFGIGLN